MTLNLAEMSVAKSRLSVTFLFCQIFVLLLICCFFLLVIVFYADLCREYLALELILICTFRFWNCHILKTSLIDLIRLMRYLRV